MNNKFDNKSIDDSIKVKSLYKAMHLLDYFDMDHQVRGISELAELSGMLKSSIHNILNTFEQCGMLKKVNGNKYELGAKILQLSHVYSAHNRMEEILKPFIDKLANDVGETVYLAIPSNGKVLYISSALPTVNLAYNSQNIRGVLAPMHCTGIGKAMLAKLPDEEIENILNQPMIQCTSNTITDKALMLEELNVINKRGYAIDNMEHEFGIRCIAIDLINSTSNIVGALSISGPSLRITEEKIEECSIHLKSLRNQVKNLI